MLGIDVSAASLSTALWLDPREPFKWERQVPNSRSGIDQLLAVTPADVPWVVEPTGRYSIPVVQQAHQAGRTVLLAPNRQAKMFLKSVSLRAKTDKIDGRGLALFAHSRPLLTYKLKNANVDQIDQLLSARRGLAKTLGELKQQAAALPLAKAATTPAIEALAANLKALDKQIAALAKNDEQFRMVDKLVMVPGIGSVTATALVSRLAAKQFKTPDQLVAYIGLDIGVRQSGKRKGETGLTKQGDAELRRLLYVCAQSTLRAKDNPFKAQYERCRERGIPSTGALCAVARKLAHVCWSMYTYESDYDAERVGKSKQLLDRDREDRATLGSDPSARSGATPPESLPPDLSQTGREALQSDKPTTSLIASPLA